MARIKVSILTLKNGETVQVTFSEGQNIKKQKQLKPMGSVIIPSVDNRLIDNTFIVDIKEIWVGEVDIDETKTLDTGNMPRKPRDKNSKAYQNYLRMREVWLEKQKHKGTEDEDNNTGAGASTEEQ